MRRAPLGLLPLDEPARLGRKLAERLRQEPHLAWISDVDLARNRFVGATRRSDGAIMINIAATDVGSGVPSERIALPDGSWRPAGLSPRKAYAVVDQPWVKAALAADGSPSARPGRWPCTSLLGAEGDPAAGELALRCASWADALARLDAGEPGEALRRFEAIAARAPDDGLAAWWCQKLAALLARPPEPAWDGIDRFEQK
jgi:hypothetical protein